MAVRKLITYRKDDGSEIKLLGDDEDVAAIKKNYPERLVAVTNYIESDEGLYDDWPMGEGDEWNDS